MKYVLFALFAIVVACVPVLPVSAERVLYSFCAQHLCPDGAFPTSLIDVDGTLYGTTEGGGTATDGTVFSLDPGTRAETVLYSFAGNPDGEDPNALIDANQTLYGTTDRGGVNGDGSVFALDPLTGAETVLYSFCSNANCTDGRSPNGVMYYSGSLYGTTYNGGSAECDAGFGCGTIFSVDPNTGAEKVLYTFCSQQNCTDGDGPYAGNAGLISGDGKLYGTTNYGGSKDGGLVFSLDPNTGAYTVLYSFCNQTNCADGAEPAGSLVYRKGVLYGTTARGGAYFQGENGGGTLFSIDVKTGTESVLYSFCQRPDCEDGLNPYGSLVDKQDTLYGATSNGGMAQGWCSNQGIGCGTAFAFDLTTGVETVVYNFCGRPNCRDGEAPTDLIDVKHRLYGTASGGAYGPGVVFTLRR